MESMASALTVPLLQQRLVVLVSSLHLRSCLLGLLGRCALGCCALDLALGARTWGYRIRRVLHVGGILTERKHMYINSVSILAITNVAATTGRCIAGAQIKRCETAA